MTTYNTLNPMPSSAPKDLYDNAQVIDEYANSELPSTTDRFGRRRDTLAGMSAQFQDALANTGFEFIGNYDDPGELTFTRRNQVMLKDGAYWSPAATTAIPVTTTGNWLTDQPKFVMRGDSALKADLASSSGALGAALVSGAVRTVDSIATLKTLPKTGSPVVFVQSYYANIKGGGGYFKVDLADVVSAANGGTIIQANDGALWKRQNNSTPLTIQDFGADMTGAVAADSILVAYQGVSSEIIFPEGQVRLNAANTLGPGKNAIFRTNASVFCTATGSLAVFGGFRAEGYGQLFYGPGSVAGMRNVWPEWWGALGNGTGDDQPAFTKAHNCLQYGSLSQGGAPTLNMQGRLYQFNATFAVQPTATFNIRIQGSGSGYLGGSRIQPSTTFPAGPVIAIVGTGTLAEQAGDFSIKDFNVLANPAGIGSCTAGIQVGAPVSTWRLEGFHCALIENVLVRNFPACWDVVHARLVNFNRCSGWNDTLAGGSAALLIRQAGNFTGDLRFDNCQFVSNVSANCASIRINSNTGLSTGAPLNMIAGIKFNCCDIYQADRKLEILAGSGSRVADIWFTNCQWDGNSNQDIYMASSGASSLIDDINFVQCYVAGGNLNPALDQLLAFTNAGGAISGISITGGNWQLAQGKTMNFQGCVGVTVDGVIIRDNNNQSGAAVEFGACTRFSFTDNRQDRVTGNFSKYTVQIGSTCNVFNVSNNIGAGIVATAVVNDLTGAVSKVVAGNL